MAKLTIVAGLLSLVVPAGAAPQEFKSIKEAMAATHKGKESMVAKVREGKGTDAEHQKALAVWEYIATQKPPQGDEASWKSKTSALIAAAVKAARRAKAPALEAYPFDADASPSASGTGYASTFRRAGFKVVARRVPARPIMRHDLRA